MLQKQNFYLNTLIYDHELAKVKEIIEARRNETSSQQHAKLNGYLDYLRESIVILTK